MDENDIKPKCYFVNEVPVKSKIDGIFERMGRLVDKEIERNRQETQINRKVKKANRRIDPINCKPGPSEPAVKEEGRFPPHQIWAVKTSPVKGLGLQFAPSSGFSDLPTAPNSTLSNSKTIVDKQHRFCQPNACTKHVFLKGEGFRLSGGGRAGPRLSREARVGPIFLLGPFVGPLIVPGPGPPLWAPAAQASADPKNSACQE